jgi:putative ABC transport system permease protein
VNWRFIFAMARRELRAARRRFLLYGGCMAIGIAVVVGLHALRETVREAVDLQSRAMLGADLRLVSRGPFTDNVLDRLATLEPDGAASLTRFGSMALVERTGRSRLVDVQAVEGGYPFYSAVETAPPGGWGDLQRGGEGALVDPSLLIQLDARVGDTLVLGDARFPIEGEIRKAPGSFGLQTQVAPRVFIAQRQLAATGLVQLGSLVEYRRYLQVAPERLAPWLRAERSALEAARVQLQTVASYQSELSRSFASLTRYLGLVGLAALALGSIGVASGVGVFVREKLDSVAVLRSLGARPRDVVATYGVLALCLGALAGAAGVLLCVPLQWLLPALMKDVLPLDVTLSLGPGAISTGVGLGLWATGLSALGPLIDVGRVAPLRALRRDFGAADDGPRGGQRLVLAAAAFSLLAVSLWQAPRLLAGLGFAAGLGAALALLVVCAQGMARLLRRHAPQRAAYWLRQGVANLFRPRNHTTTTTAAIGFALFVVASLHVVQHSVLAQITADTGADRPNLVLFDVQPDQSAPLDAFLEERGARVVDRAPLVSARLGALRGERSDASLATGELSRELRWALRREYRLTYRDDLRDTEEVVAGDWWSPGASWPERDLPVSLEEDLAKRLGVALGDRLIWQVQGVDIETVVTNIRRVDWSRLATNFFVVLPPAALEGAPQSSVVLATLADARARAELQRDLVARFPNVSALDATVILRALDAVMGQVRTAIQVLAFFLLGTGLLILLAAASASRGERQREALLLRVLGASTGLVRRIQAAEAFALGALAGVVGGGLSLLASWLLVRFLFELPFAPPWSDLGLLVFGTILLTGALGGASGWRSRSRSPLAALRD